MPATCRDVFLTMLIFSMAASNAPGQEWPRFRGPNGTGVSDARTIPATWTDADYRWRVELPGIGYSSPVVAGSCLVHHVGIGRRRHPGGDRPVHHRRLESGSGGCLRSPTPGTSSTAMHQAPPRLDGDSVYLMWAALAGLSLVSSTQQTGEERWRRDLGPLAAEHAISASPIVFEESVIVPNEQDGASSIIALDRATGETRSAGQARTEKTAYATPCLYQPKMARSSSWSTVGPTASAP